MKLKDVTIDVAVVIDINDPEQLGRIKVGKPGEFDTSSMKKELLPWVYPFSMNCHNSFSTPIPGDKVWLWQNEKNRYELYWTPFFEFETLTRHSISTLDDNGKVDSNEKIKYRNAEVVFSRNIGGKQVQLYFNEENGLMITVGIENYINIKPTGEIRILAGNGDTGMLIKGSQIYIGDQSSEPNEPSVKGNVLKDILVNLKNGLNVLKGDAMNGDKTQILQNGISQCEEALSDEKLSNLLSKNILVN